MQPLSAHTRRRLPSSLTALALTATGCSSGAGSPPGAGAEITWHQDIAPLVHEHCVGCHRDGGAAPFSLETHAQASAWAVAMLAQVEAEAMPPWGAVDTDECQHPAAFEHDPRLDEDEQALLAEWVQAGTPGGDPDHPSPLPNSGDPGLTAPDGVYGPAEPFVVDGGDDQFWCTSIDPGIDEDVWLTGLQLRPGRADVVHHALFYIDPSSASAELGKDTGYYECFGGAGIEDATLIGGYIPGARPLIPPPDTGIPLPAGARIITSFHYHASQSGPVEDLSSVALTWTDRKPRYEAGFALVGNAQNAAAGLKPGPGDPGDDPVFLVPANAKHHVERMTWEFPDLGSDAFLWSITNHMHYLGVDQLTQLERADASNDCLLHTPRWDFDWQRVYEFAGPLVEMPRLRAGDRLHLRCTYDNTLDNPALARLLKDQGLEAPVDVHLGDRSVDEMCVAAIGYAREL